MFIVRKKGLKKDGRNPTLLTAYGGFNVSRLRPSGPHGLFVDGAWRSLLRGEFARGAEFWRDGIGGMLEISRMFCDE